MFTQQIGPKSSHLFVGSPGVQEYLCVLSMHMQTEAMLMQNANGEHVYVVCLWMCVESFTQANDHLFHNIFGCTPFFFFFWFLP